MDSVGQLVWTHETHISSTYYSYNSASANDSVGWLAVDHHVLVLLQRPQQQQPTPGAAAIHAAATPSIDQI